MMAITYICTSFHIHTNHHGRSTTATPRPASTCCSCPSPPTWPSTPSRTCGGSTWTGAFSINPKTPIIPSPPHPNHPNSNQHQPTPSPRHRLEYLHAEAARIQHKLHNDLVAAGRAQATRIRLGYHSLPSLHPLHLHLISQDFDAPALKTKKHWQSFTSPFFLEAQAVGAAVREEGRVVVDRARAEAMLKAPMHCHACGAAQANMPTLKGHLARCQRAKELA